MDSFSVFLDAYNNIINGGFNLIVPEATALAGALIVFTVVLLGARIALNSGPDISSIVFTVIRAGIFLAIISNIQDVGEFVMRGFTEIGLLAGGSGQNVDDFLGSPDALMLTGYTKMADLFELSNAACKASYFGCAGNMAGYLPPSAAAYIIYGCFWLIGFSIFGTIILFKTAFLIGVPILALAINTKFESVGLGPLHFAFRSGVQLATLSVVTAIGSAVFTDLAVGTNPDFDSTVSVLTGSLVFFGIVSSTMIIAHALSGRALLAGERVFTGPARAAANAGRSAASAPIGGVVRAGAASAGSAASATISGARAAGRSFSS